jgi:hypothetical protein
MSRRIALVAAMLLAGVVLAIIGGAAALSLVGNGVFGPGGKPLTQADVQRALAQPAAATSSSRPATATATPHRHRGAPSAVPGTFTSSAGTVFASCSSGQVTLTGLLPAQGYQTDGYSAGPAGSASVKFKSSAAELTITATCAGGQPHFVSSADNRGGGGVDDHGGGGGGGSGGGSGR